MTTPHASETPHTPAPNITAGNLGALFSAITTRLEEFETLLRQKRLMHQASLNDSGRNQGFLYP